ncbi:hypothetical protein XaC1_246 [Xanthomonas phage XaC1]|nr:hypothetical protein XaC1_246 [Xanthomonas phage XaC1]
MTIFKVWLVYALILIGSLYGCFHLMHNDPDRIEHPYTMKVLRIIQEDHKSSTNYRGVFQMESGKVVDFSVTASVFVKYQPGDTISFNLSNRELGIDNSENSTYAFFVFIWCFIFGFFGAVLITEKIEPKITRKRLYNNR